ADRSGSLFSGEDGGIPEGGVLGRLEVVGPEGGHGAVAGRPGLEVRRRGGPGEPLAADLLLELHEAVQERLGPRRAPGDVDVDRDVAVDALQDVVALLERAAGDGAGAHRDA